MKLGYINQIATPLQQGDLIEVYNTYADKTVVGNLVTSIQIIKSSNEKVEEGEIHLVASYKVSTISLWEDILSCSFNSKTLINELLKNDN